MSLQVNIVKKYRDFTLEIDLDTDRECMGILGASGCGKSMTLKCIAGILTPDSGRIVLNGRVLFDSEKKIDITPQERGVGYLFQNYALFPKMTVRRNIEMGMLRRPGADKSEVDELLRTFHLEELGERYPGQLSGGQQQRVALARILAGRPSVLLLDEPFSALDSFLKEQLQVELQKVLASYSGDVLMVTHSRDEVYRFCDSAVIMDQGHPVDRGRTEDLFYHPKQLITARLSGCKNFSRARKLGEHQVEATDWKMILRTESTVPDEVRFVGVRAHDWIPGDTDAAENALRCRYRDASVGPFEAIVRLQAEGTEGDEGIVWWKLDTPVWRRMGAESLPEVFVVSPEKVLVLQ